MFLKTMSKLVTLEHIIFSIPFIFISMIVASNGWFGWKLLVLGVIEAVTARNFAMGVNRYLDRDIDVLNDRTKDRPSVNGEVSTSEMKIFIFVNGAIFVFVASLINSLTFKISIPILLVLGGYTYFKRFSPMAHLTLGIALGLAPIAGAVVVLNHIPGWSLFLAIGVMFWVAGFDILYSLQDMEFDKKNGLFSIPSIYGVKSALDISKLFHIFTILFWCLFLSYTGAGFFGWLGLTIVSYILYKEHKIVNESFENIPIAFFQMNSYIGIIMIISIMMDRI